MSTTTTDPPAKLFLTKEEAAEILSITPSQLEDLRRAKKVKAFATGGTAENPRRWRYTRASLEEYVRALTAEASEGGAA